jgi:phospholipase/carboxylesterase
MELQIITIPATVTPKQGAIVVLHGWGANAEDAAQFAGVLKTPDWDRLMPDGPFQHPYSDLGRMWYGLDSMPGFDADLSNQADLVQSRSLLQAWLTQLPKTTGVPLERTILGGFSQGGAMTIDVGLTLPLAGLMVLSGYLHKSLAGFSQPTMPILQVHGQQDRVVPISVARKTRDALRQIGANVDYQEHGGMGHEISMTVLEQMQAFINQTQKTN